MRNEKIENIEETEVEVLDTYTDEPEEAESSKGISKKLIAAFGALTIGGAVAYLCATKDKREAKRDEKQKQRLEARGYVISKKVEETEPAEDVSEEVVPEENKQ